MCWSFEVEIGGESSRKLFDLFLTINSRSAPEMSIIEGDI